jgi:hypothetical protein
MASPMRTSLLDGNLSVLRFGTFYKPVCGQFLDCENSSGVGQAGSAYFL